MDNFKEILHYSPDSGIFTRLSTGERAGTVNGCGYRQIRIQGKIYLEHRLAWLYMYGEWPEFEVDHRNRNKADNRIDNLRVATHAQNHANRSADQDNLSGTKGVYLPKGRDKWMARIMKDGKQHYLGVFDSREEAHAAYSSATETLNGEFARAA